MPNEDDVREEDKGDDGFEPITLGENDEALVLALEGLSRIAGHLRNFLSRQPEASRFAPRITELGTIELLSSGVAARVAHHYDIDLHWIRDAEEPPVAVPDETHPGYRLCRLLANSFVAIVPEDYRVSVLESVLWFHAPMAGSGVSVFDMYVDSADPPTERVEKIATLAATRLQELIVAEMGRPWPHGAVDAKPCASYLDDQLTVWWEEEGGRLLELPKISASMSPGIYRVPL